MATRSATPRFSAVSVSRGCGWTRRSVAHFVARAADKQPETGSSGSRPAPGAGATECVPWPCHDVESGGPTVRDDLPDTAAAEPAGGPEPGARVVTKPGARVCFALTALVAFSGVALQLWVAAGMTGGHFTSPIARVANVFVYFTIESNLIVGVTCGLLAFTRRRPSTVFRVFRLTGVVAIAITGVVYHAVLAGLVDLTAWGNVATQMLHTAVPLLAVAGWLLFGPRGLATWRTAALALAFPVFWLGCTLIRGAVTHWYPYPFVDADALGYARVALNVAVVTVLFLGLSYAAAALDLRLSRRGDRRSVTAADAP